MRWRTVLVSTALLALLGGNLVWAFVATSYARLSEKLLAVAVSPQPPPVARAAPPTPRAVSHVAPFGLARFAVIQLSETTFVVDHAVVDEFLENQAELMRTARFVPATSEGERCVRLYGLRSGALATIPGFENGDCVVSINGFALATPEQGLEAYARLRTSDYLEVRLRRRGREMELRYYIE